LRLSQIERQSGGTLSPDQSRKRISRIKLPKARRYLTCSRLGIQPSRCAPAFCMKHGRGDRRLPASGRTPTYVCSSPHQVVDTAVVAQASRPRDE
jgi:hypothetical protein